MASLTKIMTCYTVLILQDKLKFNLEENVRTSKSSVKVFGTNA